MPETEDTLATLAGLEDAGFHRLQARLAILRAYAQHRAEHGLSDAAAQEEAARRYAARALEVAPWVYDAYATFSGRTLRRWEERLLAGGLQGLSDDHGPRSGRTYASYFDPGTELRKAALHFLADHPGCTSTDLLGELERRFPPEDVPDRRTVQRFLARMT